MDRHEMLEELLKHFGNNHEKLLEEIVRGMSNDEMKESYDFIKRMWDLPEKEIECSRCFKDFVPPHEGFDGYCSECILALANDEEAE